MQHRQPPSLSNNWQSLPLAIVDQQELIEAGEIRLARLAETSSTGDPALLCWSQAREDGLVLGFSQKADVLNPATLAKQPLPIYHRRAGGTAVLVGPHLLGLDVLLPADHPLILPDLVESYRWLGETWVDALRLLGLETRTVSPGEVHEQRALLKQADEGTAWREAILRRACYGSLSPYEVVAGAGQRKVVGLDMIRRRSGSLLQAGVLLHWDVERLATLLGHTLPEQEILREGLRARAVGLDELLGRVIEPPEVIAAFEQAMMGFNKLGQHP